MIEFEVTQLFEDRIAEGLSLTQTVRGACGALADWAAREWEKLSSDDRDELVTVGAVLLCLSVRTEYPRRVSRWSGSANGCCTTTLIAGQDGADDRFGQEPVNGLD
jgi:hypothetical protein